MEEKADQFSKRKLLLEKELADVLLEAVEDDKIKLTDMRPIAKNILPEFKKISDFKQMVVFLKKISQQWEFFSKVYLKYKGEDQKDKEQQVIDKLSSYIESFK